MPSQLRADASLESLPSTTSSSSQGHSPTKHQHQQSQPQPRPEIAWIPSHYESLLTSSDSLSMPIAAVETLATLLERLQPTTSSELLSLLSEASALLRTTSFSPISLTAGCELFMRFVTLQRPPLEMESFERYRSGLVSKAREFVRGSRSCVDKIKELGSSLIADGQTILTHSYSRVVIATLIHAYTVRKVQFRVFVTEARPFGLGIKTHAMLTSYGIPCTILLDSAVSYAMAKVDAVIVGAEAVAQNGGLVNFIGNSQVALSAKVYHKPLYALAESFKFTRVYPLTQYDLPTSVPLLTFPQPSSPPPSQTSTSAQSSPSKQNLIPPTPSRPMLTSPPPKPLEMSAEEIEKNPLLDFTEPQFITLVVSDVGILTPSGVSDTLLSIFGGE